MTDVNKGKVFEFTKDELDIKKSAFAVHHYQLIMARYAMHRVRVTIYAQKVLSGQMTHEEAEGHYRAAMDNYDQILNLAASEPSRIGNCEKDMAAGFVIPEHPMFWQKEGKPDD